MSRRLSRNRWERRSKQEQLTIFQTFRGPTWWQPQITCLWRRGVCAMMTLIIILLISWSTKIVTYRSSRIIRAKLVVWSRTSASLPSPISHLIPRKVLLLLPLRKPMTGNRSHELTQIKRKKRKRRQSRISSSSIRRLGMPLTASPPKPPEIKSQERPRRVRKTWLVPLRLCSWRECRASQGRRSWRRVMFRINRISQFWSSVRQRTTRTTTYSCIGETAAKDIKDGLRVALVASPIKCVESAAATTGGGMLRSSLSSHRASTWENRSSCHSATPSGSIGARRNKKLLDSTTTPRYSTRFVILLT